MNRWSELPSDIALLIFKHLDHEAKQLHHPVTYFSTIDSEQEFSPTAIHNLRATCKPWKRVIDNATRRLLLCGHEKTVINSMNFPALEVLDTSLAERVRLLPTAENSSQEEAHNGFLASSCQVVSPTVQIIRKPLLRNTGLEKRTTFSGRKSLKCNKHHMSKQQGSVITAHYRPNLPKLTDLTINAAEISQISLIKTCPQLCSLSIDNKGSFGIANLPSATSSLRSRTRALARALSSGLTSLSTLTFLHVDLLLGDLWQSMLSLSLECLSLQYCPCPWFLAPQYNDRAITSALVLGHVLPGTTWTSASLRSTSGAWRPDLCTSPLAPLAATLTSLTLKACFLHPEDVYVKGPCGGTLLSHKRVVGRRGNKRSRALASDNGGGTVPGGVVLQQQALQAEGASTSGTHGLHYLQQDENLSVDNLDIASEQSAPDGGVEEAAGMASAAAVAASGQAGTFIGAGGDDGQLGEEEALPISDLHARDFFQALQPLTKLQNLDLSNNWIGVMHSGIGHISSLRSLDLSGNKLSTLPHTASRLTALTALDLSHNHIEEVPEAIRTLRKLRVLNLARNWLNGSTLGFLSGLTQLQTLDISYVFSMNVFPVELCSLTDLTQLGLKCTYVHSFPEEVSRLSSLNSLDISFNSQLEHHEVSKILRPMQKLKALSLSHLDLEMFPEVLWTLTQLTLLELSRNRIRNISPDISLLTNLEALNLQGTFSCRHGTSLVALAPSLYCLTKLRILNLGCNFAGKMPAGISQLSRLQTLSLCMNGLLRLPPGIERLQMLSKLDIRHNQLRLPPAALFELKSLRRLAIHGNQLRPAALEQLEKHLVLQHCKIIQ